MTNNLFTAERARAQHCRKSIDVSSELTWVLSEFERRCYLQDSLFWTTELSKMTISDLKALGYSVTAAPNGGVAGYVISWA